jgi:hypothetical protein
VKCKCQHCAAHTTLIAPLCMAAGFEDSRNHPPSHLPQKHIKAAASELLTHSFGILAFNQGALWPS